jgi:hypothetical protein
MWPPEALVARYRAFAALRCTSVGTCCATVMPLRDSCRALSGLLLSSRTDARPSARRICAAAV